MKKYAIFTMVWHNNHATWQPTFIFDTELEMLEWLYKNNRAIEYSTGYSVVSYPDDLADHFQENLDGSFSPKYHVALGQEVWK